jgi:D-alanine-D-alanine ligase
MHRNKRVGVLLGGPSSEREVSLRTGAAVAKALREKGYEVVELDLNELTASRLLERGVGVIYNALHGKWGEDGCVQGLLEILRIPYTGPGVTASAVGMDKVISKRLFEAEGLPVAPYRVLSRAAWPPTAPPASPLPWPVVVKPATEGSSVGVAIVDDEAAWRKALAEAFAMDERAVVETYLPGRELQVAVLGDQALGLVEVRPKKVAGERFTFYDYAHKYTKGMTEYFTRPDNLPTETADRLLALAVKANQAIGGEGVVRVDFILDERGELWLLEVNTLPGLTELSLVPMIARDWRGLAFADLVEMVLKTARLKIGA